jgi:hypothetical protein
MKVTRFEEQDAKVIVDTSDEHHAAITVLKRDGTLLLSAVLTPSRNTVNIVGSWDVAK